VVQQLLHWSMRLASLIQVVFLAHFSPSLVGPVPSGSATGLFVERISAAVSCAPVTRHNAVTTIRAPPTMIVTVIAPPAPAVVLTTVPAVVVPLAETTVTSVPAAIAASAWQPKTLVAHSKVSIITRRPFMVWTTCLTQLLIGITFIVLSGSNSLFGPSEDSDI